MTGIPYPTLSRIEHAEQSMPYERVVALADALDASFGADAQLAIRSFTEQAAVYVGALLNLYVLAGLRRGASACPTCC